MKRRTMKGRLASLGVVALTVGGAMAAVTASPAMALDASYQAHAVGDGVRVSWTVPHAPITDKVADFGGPVAEALLDSIGESSAYASFPFPGAGPATSPALIRGASGGGIPAPDYPFFVFSKSPANPKQEFGGGPYTIKAQSDEHATSAAVAMGGDGGESASLGLSKVDARSEALLDRVVAEAHSETRLIAIGPLHIGRVFSVATTTYGADGALKRAADTVLEGVTVMDKGIKLTPTGSELGGQKGPGPDLKSLNQGLTGAGISVELVPRQDTSTGVTAPALRVTRKDASGGGTIVYTIGTASAFIDATLLGPGENAAGPDTAARRPAAPVARLDGVVTSRRDAGSRA